MQNQDNLEPMFDDLAGLTEIQRSVLKERYRFLMREYRRRCRLYAIMFYVLRITMTVGSITVPALMSITRPEDMQIGVYWLTWAVSLSVTISNGLLTLFKLDKRYFMLNAVAERLRTETWQYLALSGRYSGHHGTNGHHRATHVNQYVYYCSQIEKIRMKHVDDEFIRPAAAEGEQVTAPQKINAVDEHAPANSSNLVPSPAEQMTSPTPHMVRRHSSSTIGSNDTAIDIGQENEKKIYGPMSLSNSIRSEMSERGEEREPVLPAAPEVPGVTDVGRGTGLQPREVQSESASAGNP
jgi:hypothetical protein